MIRHYETLHLKPSATQEQIRQAYLDLARVWHPDRFASDERLRKVAEEKMIEISAAYQALLELPGEAVRGTEPMRDSDAPAPQVSPPAANTSLASDVRLRVAGGAAAIAVILSIVWWLVPTGGASQPDAISGADLPPEASVERNPRLPSPARGIPTGREPAARAGAGEIQIHNQTNSAAILRISTAGAKDRILNTSTVPAGDVAILRNLSPESYVIDATFSDSRSAPLHLGPFDILQITTAGGVEADRYEITLKPGATR